MGLMILMRLRYTIGKDLAHA